VIDGPSDSNGTPQIVWRLRLSAAPERVFAAWLSPSDHERFWCERSETLPDGSFHQHFIDGTVACCAIEETEAPDHIRMRYLNSRVDIVTATRADLWAPGRRSTNRIESELSSSRCWTEPKTDISDVALDAGQWIYAGTNTSCAF
jgi:uncharacterized protein YndB with AHSA1/START domain